MDNHHHVLPEVEGGTPVADADLAALPAVGVDHTADCTPSWPSKAVSVYLFDAEIRNGSMTRLFSYNCSSLKVDVSLAA